MSKIIENFNPRVSIIIPVYNGANYLKDSIDSALNQTYKNIEIIVINDGSDDDGATEQIIKIYGEKIKYVLKENGGVSSALNTGISIMKGEYFSWLSHDDRYKPIKIEREVEAIRGCPEKLVFSDVDYINCTGKKICKGFHHKGHKMSDIETSIYPVKNQLINGCTLLIHKDFFTKFGTFDETLLTTQDYDMWLRIFKGQYTKYLSESLIESRLHRMQGSKTIISHTDEKNLLNQKINASDPSNELKLLSNYSVKLRTLKTIYKMRRGFYLAFSYLRTNGLKSFIIRSIKFLKTIK